MATMTETCQQCGKQFLILDKEQAFLKEHDLSLPKNCSNCRQERRLALRIKRQLYQINCQQCGKETIVTYNPQQAKSKMLCREDYDKYFSENSNLQSEPVNFATMTPENFFAELQRLIDTLPKRPARIDNSENCTFADKINFSKNLYYCFDLHTGDNCSYVFSSYMIVNSRDCDYSVELQNCYECFDVYTAFNSDFIDNSTKMADSSYCSECTNSHDLFGCVHLDNKSYCIFNRQLSEADYREQVKKYKQLPPEKILTIVESLKERFPLPPTHERNNDNTFYGNHIYNDKNCYLCFDAAYDEDCFYMYDSYYGRHCMDMTYASNGNEFCYQMIDTTGSNNCKYMFESTNCVDSSYIFNSFDAKNCFGGVNLYHKQYCILNRQYSKEEYEKYSKQIWEMLKAANAGWNNLTY